MVKKFSATHPYDGRCSRCLHSEPLSHLIRTSHAYDRATGAMAMLSSHGDHRFRPSNKEPDWSSLCNNVFDEYLDSDDLFVIEANQGDRSSSSNSANLFDFSASSEQSHQTDGTSPIPSIEPHVQQGAVIEARQPRAKEPVNFWTKTLQALEQNAAECERKQQTLRTVKSHPDFLSLGGCPSPPAVPLSPTDQSFSAQGRVSRSTANGKKRNVTARSVSRGRALCVSKPAPTESTNQYATVRRCSASPSKMMNPSRFRAGFKDTWAEKLHASPEKYAIRVRNAALPVSPPPSARGQHHDGFAAFGSPHAYPPPVPAFDDQISPLTTHFQHAHLHTPVVSPSANHGTHFHNAYVGGADTGHPPTAYRTHGLPVTDIAPLYPERTSSLGVNRIQAFDFGFTSAPTSHPWSAGSTAGPSTAFTDDLDGHDPFAALSSVVLPSIETHDFGLSGLGISCDTLLAPHYDPLLHTSTISPSIVHSSAGAFDSIPATHGLPMTPHRRAKSCHRRSISPSPPATEPRSSKRASSSRRASRHRRAKSTNATPRQPHAQVKEGFVNFTAEDSNKILSGVAPSGSSKTKARREKEAADRRRRLSQAAVRAVVEAGGDLDALNQVGLLI